MTRKKVCLLGDLAVGKTSLVRRFVESIFSEAYHSTIGVRIARRDVAVDGRDVGLVFWDLAGVADWQELPTSYLRGASGALLVADGTRAETLEHVLDLVRRLPAPLAGVPLHLLLNKSDLTAEWALHSGTADLIGTFGLTCAETSARTGAGVEQAFAALAAAMLEPGSATRA